MGFRRRGSSAPSAERETGLNSGSVDTVLSGDAFKPADGGPGPGKSSLFFLTRAVGPEMPLWLDPSTRLPRRPSRATAEAGLASPVG